MDYPPSTHNTLSESTSTRPQFPATPSAAQIRRRRLRLLWSYLPDWWVAFSTVAPCVFRLRYRLLVCTRPESIWAFALILSLSRFLCIGLTCVPLFIDCWNRRAEILIAVHSMHWIMLTALNGNLTSRTRAYNTLLLYMNVFRWVSFISS